MGKLVLAFSMSLDGFVAGPRVSAEHAMGVGGERLHDWMFGSGWDRTVDDAMAAELAPLLGAVILGRTTFDIGLAHWQDTPYPAPSFVLTHRAESELQMKSASFTFVTTGIEAALEQAQNAAGEKHIVVMGADTAQQYLRAGLVDELYLQLVPVLLGEGSRLFDTGAPGLRELELTRLAQSPVVTHLRYSVRAAV